MNEQDKYYVFFSRIPNSTYIFPDGVQAAFVNGRYTTKDAGRAAHLQGIVEEGNPHIYIDPEKTTLTEAELDPMAEYDARVIAKYLAAQASQTSNDMGSSEQGRLNVADTSNIAAAASGSDSGATPGIKVSLGK